MSNVVVSASASRVPTNASVTVASTTTEVLAAPTKSISRIVLLKNTGAQTVFLAFGESATTSKFPLGTGETLRTTYAAGAINGIVSSGTCTVAVLVEQYT